MHRNGGSIASAVHAIGALRAPTSHTERPRMAKLSAICDAEDVHAVTFKTLT